MLRPGLLKMKIITDLALKSRSYDDKMDVRQARSKKRLCRSESPTRSSEPETGDAIHEAEMAFVHVDRAPEDNGVKKCHTLEADDGAERERLRKTWQ